MNERREEERDTPQRLCAKDLGPRPSLSRGRRNFKGGGRARGATSENQQNSRSGSISNGLRRSVADIKFSSRLVRVNCENFVGGTVGN